MYVTGTTTEHEKREIIIKRKKMEKVFTSLKFKVLLTVPEFFSCWPFLIVYPERFFKRFSFDDCVKKLSNVKQQQKFLSKKFKKLCGTLFFNFY